MNQVRQKVQHFLAEKSIFLRKIIILYIVYKLSNCFNFWSSHKIQRNFPMEARIRILSKTSKIGLDAEGIIGKEKKILENFRGKLQ